MERQGRFRDLMPNSCTRAVIRSEALRSVCRLNRDIATIADQMAVLEHGFGVTAIIPHPSPLARVTVAVMVMARLLTDVNGAAHEVEDIADLVGGRDPEDALTVRNLFRNDSPLRAHIRLNYAATLDESGVRLKEASLNKILANKPDEGSEHITDALCVTTKWK